MGKAKQKAHIQGIAMGEEKASNNQEAASNSSWASVNKSNLPMSAFLWVEDPKKKTTWHLPYKDENGNVNLGALRAVSAALGGARSGKPMNIPSEVRSKINRLLKQYKIGKYASDKKSEEEIRVDGEDIKEAEMGLMILTLARKFNSVETKWCHEHRKNY